MMIINNSLYPNPESSILHRTRYTIPHLKNWKAYDRKLIELPTTEDLVNSYINFFTHHPYFDWKTIKFHNVFTQHNYIILTKR